MNLEQQRKIFSFSAVGDPDGADFSCWTLLTLRLRQLRKLGTADNTPTKGRNPPDVSLRACKLQWKREWWQAKRSCFLFIFSLPEMTTALLVCVFSITSHEMENHRAEHRHGPMSLQFESASHTGEFVTLIRLEPILTDYHQVFWLLS